MLNKQQALEWCVKHIAQWPKHKPSIKPDGWKWVVYNVDGIMLVDDGRSMYIDDTAWLRHKFRPINCRSSFSNITVTLNDNATASYLRQLINEPLSHYKDHHTPADVPFAELMRHLNQ